MDMIGRSYMLITSRSLSFCQILPKTGNYSDIMLLLDTRIDVICCRSRQVVVLEYNRNCPAVNF